MLLATVDLVHPRAVLLALDSRERSYRHDLLPGYQGQRDPFPRELTDQLDALPELAEAFGYAAAKVPPFEADDLLASGVEAELARGGRALVMTSDRDAYQLVGARTSVLVPCARRQPPELVDVAGVQRSLRRRARAGSRPDRAARRPLRRDPRRERHRRRQARPTCCAATARSRA